MGGIFSGMGEGGDYNTVTSPDEQGAAATGNDQGPTQKLPMQNIMAAVMRGAARVQGQEQAKAVAKSQAASNARMSVTMKPGEPGGPPLVTVKDAPADLLNGTQQTDLQKAYDTPMQQVNAKIGDSGPAPQSESRENAPVGAAPAAQPPTLQPPADHPLEQAAAAVDAAKGYRLPRPWDNDVAAKLTNEAGLQSIAEEMGLKDTKAEAHRAWRQLQHGVVKPEEVIRRVADFRAHKIEEESHALQATLAPYNAEKDAAQRETDRQSNEARLLKNQSDAELKSGNDEKLNWLKTTDLSIVDPDKLEETARSSTNAPWTASDLNRAKLKQQQDVNKAFLDYTDTKKDSFALGNQPTWDAAKAAFGHPLTPDQDRIGQARWQAAHVYAVRKAADDSAQQELRGARLEAIQARIESAGKEKPTVIGRGDLALMPASELLSTDPSKVKNYDQALEAKEGLIQKELRDHQEKLDKANAQAKAILTKSPDRKQFGDEEQLAGFQADAKIAKSRVDAATGEIQQIQAARAARKQGKAPVAAKPAASGTLQRVNGKLVYQP